MPDEIRAIPIKPVDLWVRRTTAEAIRDYGMIREGDRILVAVSGGKDSWSMAHLLRHFRRVSPVRFELTGVTIDLGLSESAREAIRATFDAMDMKHEVVAEAIPEIIASHNSPGKNPCAFCARLRRGVLYSVARRLGCTTVALGHHADDAVQTVLMSGFFEGKLCSMPPVFETADQVRVIRPLIRVWEKDLGDYCRKLGITPIACPADCSERGSARVKVKELLERIEATIPDARRMLLRSLHQVNPSHFLDKRWL